MTKFTDRHTGQACLPESCPVCDHNPISPDLCKPNKALRTTLKAFLRTEEKKREKDRTSSTPITPTVATPADNAATVSAGQESGGKEPLIAVAAEDAKPEEPSVDGALPEATVENAGEGNGDVEAAHNVSATYLSRHRTSSPR
jgi:hypothetical protein